MARLLTTDDSGFHHSQVTAALKGQDHELTMFENGKPALEPDGSGMLGTLPGAVTFISNVTFVNKPFQPRELPAAVHHTLKNIAQEC